MKTVRAAVANGVSEPIRFPLAEKSLVGSLYGSADMARDVRHRVRDGRRDLHRAPAKRLLHQLVQRAGARPRDRGQPGLPGDGAGALHDRRGSAVDRRARLSWEWTTRRVELRSQRNLATAARPG